MRFHRRHQGLDIQGMSRVTITAPTDRTIMKVEAHLSSGGITCSAFQARMYRPNLGCPVSQRCSRIEPSDEEVGSLRHEGRCRQQREKDSDDAEQQSERCKGDHQPTASLQVTEASSPL
jgi:hypothetical protein